jgi:ectoine hydroxylase-related dioxygenase (phytanoyl-CoA dioxygenase family)
MATSLRCTGRPRWTCRSCIAASVTRIAETTSGRVMFQPSWYRGPGPFSRTWGTSRGDPVPELRRIKAPEGPSAIVAALQSHGAVIVEDLLDHELLDRFNAELDPLLEKAAPDHGGAFLNPAIEWFFGQRTRHVTGVSAKSPIFSAEILIHPLYLSVADAILGGNCARYQLNLAHVLDRGPGSERQYLHRDEIVWIHVPDPHPELQLASVIALVDFTADNGATVVAPGSHLWPKGRQAVEDDLVVAEMNAGSAVLYLGSTVHGGARQYDRLAVAPRHAPELRGWVAAHRGEPLSDHSS